MEREDGAEPRDFTPDFFPKLRRATAAAALVLLICAAASLAALFGSSSFDLQPQRDPHFFCEVMAVLRLVCEDISAYEEAAVTTSIFVLLLPFSLILSSHVLILLAVLQMSAPAVSGTRKF
ncbi:Olfactory Receptor 2T7 [Manis pentadactyla]|nr:Olfactory Receptor 2T7 [Manis pentadactyla]